MKIALIEDDKVLSKALGGELEDAGFEVVHAYDGEQGFNVVKTEKPDLVLLDIIMPKLDGVSLLKRLKEDEEIKTIPVVMLTVFGSHEKIANTIEIGADAYFIKDQQSMSNVVNAVKGMLEEGPKREADSSQPTADSNNKEEKTEETVEEKAPEVAGVVEAVKEVLVEEKKPEEEE